MMQMLMMHLNAAIRPQKKARRFCLLWIFFLLLAILLLTYGIGLWKVELAYGDMGFSPELRQTESGYLPNIVIKSPLLSHLKSKYKKEPGDLISLMKDINVESFNRVQKPSCEQVINSNWTAIKEGLIYQKIHHSTKTTDSAFIRMVTNCENFIHQRKYVTESIPQEELEFPLAFSILVFEDVEQFETLLQAIYRPHNYYCIHIDLKSPQSFHESIRAIARCFKNVFVASKLVRVDWGTYTVLEPDLICMEDLWKYVNWTYFINLTGKEFPLKTNLEIVKILKVFNGANNMEATLKWRNKERVTYIYNGTDRTQTRKPPPPVPISLTKGSVHIVGSRSFVGYVLHDRRALAFREWIKDTGIPDETFFSSLGHSPQMDVPGSYLGHPETDSTTYPFLTRFKNWGATPYDYPCYGMRLRRICVFGLGDLPLLTKRPELFANKFHSTFQPMALECMAEWHRNNTLGDLAGNRVFDVAKYGKYEFVWNHV